MRQPLSKEARREAIYRGAIRLFETKGYENVTIADVIAASNVARGTFYLHFESLEALLIEWFDDVIEETWSHIRPFLDDLSIPFEDCTRKVIHEVFQLYSDNPSMSKVFYCGGGETFMRRRHEAMFGKLGGKLLEALVIRHPECHHDMSWTVAILISMIGDMAHFAGQYIDKNMRKLFEDRVSQFAIAGLREHLNHPYIP
ncbi:TetR/AcrR family transcriptional regulator [Alicyclobacillus dauci]|uniref:TetR/AcrR family transcriptional regulator n=1 Tax=Alicyclobacillus dauci TaxID=1475485 RepID=A0ABY6YZ16_9BACL|nr:TetR/AcrR family transcriptional regulator [Alicyclobacillus dauci]WAH35877.1 TetR/AcrR family transcriptional regulator [Alicyclobacillus dauci]